MDFNKTGTNILLFNDTFLRYFFILIDFLLHIKINIWKQTLMNNGPCLKKSKKQKYLKNKLPRSVLRLCLNYRIKALQYTGDLITINYI